MAPAAAEPRGPGPATDNNAVAPLIEEFARTRDRLREVTRADVDAALGPLQAHPRYNAVVALRSLFRLAKRRGMVFTDPTRHLAGLGQHLADLARAALLSWLRHRRELWPHTANRQVLLSRITALGTGPVSDDYLIGLLPDRINLEWIRQDRILHEALISGADPLRLALVFGIDHSTAMTYAALARAILDGADRSTLMGSLTANAVSSRPGYRSATADSVTGVQNG